MEKMIFSRKSQLSFWGDGMAGVSVGKWANYEGGEGETPLHFLVDSFGADGKSGIFGAVAQVGKSA